MSEYKADIPRPDEEKTGAADLLKIANRIKTIARRAENLIVGPDKLRHFLINRGNEPDKTRRTRALLLASQAARDAKLGEPDLHFVIICSVADDLAEQSLPDDSARNVLFEEMKATLTEQGKVCDPEDDGTWPQEFLTRFEEFYRRQEEAREQSFIAILRRHGEDEMADLYLTNFGEYWRRFSAGLRILTSKDSDALARINEMLDKLDKLDAENQKFFMRLAAGIIVGTPST